MATNKELVEQAVSAIPKWMAFLDSKQAEQNLILEQMQDDGTQFAPKSLTQRLTDRLTATKDKLEPINQVNDDQQAVVNQVNDDQQAVVKQVNDDQQAVVKLKKEGIDNSIQERSEVVEEEEVVEEKKEKQVKDGYHPVSSELDDDDDRQTINDNEFKDLF